MGAPVASAPLLQVPTTGIHNIHTKYNPRHHVSMTHSSSYWYDYYPQHFQTWYGGTVILDSLELRKCTTKSHLYREFAR
jgi:hypothetical protein